MNQTNTDYLFQVIATPSDRPTSAARSGEDSPGFRDHLSSASTSVYDLPQQPSRRESANSTQRRDEPSDVTRNRESHPRPESLAESDRSAAAPPVDQAAEDDHDHDNGNDETSGEVAGGVAGASQEASKQTAAKDGNDHESAGKPNTQLEEQLELEADAAKNAGDQNEAAKAVQTNSASSELAVGPNVHADEVAEVEVAVAGATPGDGAEITTDSADAKHAEKSARRGKHSNKEGVEAAQVAQQSEAKVAQAPENTAASDPTPASTPANADATANGKADELKPEGDDRESTEGDARRGEKSSDRGSARNEAPAAKVDGTPIVAALSAESPDASNDASGSKESDKATKPIAAKDETTVGPLARAMRAATEITRGARWESSNDMPQVDPARFVGRVAKAFETANERGGSLQLRLSPPELGSLKLQLTVKDGVMSATLETDNANARRLLLDHLPALRDRLAEQNIRVERFDVDVRQESSGGQADPRGFQQNPYQQQTERTEARRGNGMQQRVAEVAEPARPVAVPLIGSDGINLVI